MCQSRMPWLIKQYAPSLVAKAGLFAYQQFIVLDDVSVASIWKVTIPERLHRAWNTRAAQ